MGIHNRNAVFTDCRSYFEVCEVAVVCGRLTHNINEGRMDFNYVIVLDCVKSDDELI